MLSARIRGISPSATLAVDAKAKQLKKEGKDMVIFGAGEPDFNTPDNIKEAAKRAVDNNITRYTPAGGMPDLKKAVAEKFKSFNKINYDLSEVMIACGAKHALFNIAMAILDKGDEVIVPVPYWVSYAEMIKLAEAKSVFCKSDDKFKLTAKDVEEKITDKTKAIILNFPNNPSGATIDESELRKIADIAVKNNLYVVSDEVYEHFVYGNSKFVSIASLNEDIKRLTITVNSVSKTYAMTGWRIGYCGAPKEIIKPMTSLQSHSTSNPSNIAQMAALEAITGPQDSVKQMVQAFDERRKFIHKRLNEIDGIKCVEPEGAFYAFADISGTGMNSMDFASKLLDEALVAVVPGGAFGVDICVRLSYATSVKEISKGLDRIDKWLKSRK
ncbi:aspartate aminotransferase [Candidatus Woesearchaeota archaeon]|jgi:aspartate aminotransferase|nr:aspartate aminotransferase [Candidatus Woesearchaeota archaeon]|tara:strand:+ start:18526 stop:19683 length:1158 start_codon:yes stop_codon:yes gene_type:complete